MIRKEDINGAEEKIYDILAGIILDAQSIDEIGYEFGKLRSKALDEYIKVAIEAYIDNLENKLQNKCCNDIEKEFNELRNKIEKLFGDENEKNKQYNK